MKIRSSLIIVAASLAASAFGQTVYTPGGTVGTSTNSKVGIGTSSPISLLDIKVPNENNVNEGLVVERADGASFFGFKLKSDGSGNYRSALTVKAHGGSELEALTILTDFSSGFVGIGSSTPATKLDVVHDNNGQAAIYLRNPNAGTAAYTELGLLNDLGPGHRGSVYKTSSTYSGAEGANSLNIWNASNASLGFATTGTVRMSITGAGNVGIGTANPGALFSLGTSLGSKFMLYDAGGGTGYGFGIQNSLLQIFSNTAVDRVGIGHGNSTSFTETLSVVGGKVGIGTIAPTHLLAVNGTIRAKEVIVDSGWADYVFEEDYRLAPLAEVESHIQAKKHLPGIPSAAEVAAGGVSLGEMQAKLLAKVEELTLHLIAQEKRIQSLEAENATLRTKFN